MSPRQHASNRGGSPHKKHQNRREEGSVRIIGGTWRGRKLPVPVVPGLRPTTDRVRETLFNWLMYDVAGAHCLDLFCGSGVLGLEALSRGASSLVAVDLDAGVVHQMKNNLSLLGCDHAQVVQADSLQWIQSAGPTTPFDLVFLDPPFRKSLLEEAIDGLSAQNLVHPGTKVYIESESELGSMNLPPDWELMRDKKAGQVRFQLYRVGE